MQEMARALLTTAPGLAEPPMRSPDMPNVTTCQCDLAKDAPITHEWMLTLETRGATGIHELIREFDHQADDGVPEYPLSWTEFPTFVAEHNWQDPFAMSRLAEWIDTAIRRRIRAPHLSA